MESRLPSRAPRSRTSVVSTLVGVALAVGASLSAVGCAADPAQESTAAQGATLVNAVASEYAAFVAEQSPYLKFPSR